MSESRWICRSRTAADGVTKSVATRSGAWGSWWSRLLVADQRISVFAAFIVGGDLNASTQRHDRCTLRCVIVAPCMPLDDSILNAIKCKDLHFIASALLCIPHSPLFSLATRGFRNAGSSVWNSFLLISAIDSYTVFKFDLKLTFPLVQEFLALNNSIHTFRFDLIMLICASLKQTNCVIWNIIIRIKFS